MENNCGIEHCAICFKSSICYSCESPYSLFNGNCMRCEDADPNALECDFDINSFITILKCKNGYYLSSPRTCSSCIPNCTYCSSNTTCSLCNEGYYPESNNGTCGVCNGHCQTNEPGTSNCKICENGYINYNGCCKKCEELIPHSTECLYNKENNLLINLKCNNNYYSSIFGCDECSDNCVKCESKNSCLQCEDGYLNNKGKCIRCNELDSNAILCENGDVNSRAYIKNCSEKYIISLGQNKCYFCNNKCEECNNNYDPYYFEGNCISCKEPYINNYGVCSFCFEHFPNAISCYNGGIDSKAKIKECDNGYYLSNNNTCLINHPEPDNNNVEKKDNKNVIIISLSVVFGIILIAIIFVVVWRIFKRIRHQNDNIYNHGNNNRNNNRNNNNHNNNLINNLNNIPYGNNNQINNNNNNFIRVENIQIQVRERICTQCKTDKACYKLSCGCSFCDEHIGKFAPWDLRQSVIQQNRNCNICHRRVTQIKRISFKCDICFDIVPRAFTLDCQCRNKYYCRVCIDRALNDHKCFFCQQNVTQKIPAEMDEINI